MKKIFYFTVFVFSACTMPSSNTSVSNTQAKTMNMDSTRNDLMQADKDFSTMSASKGRNAAFLEYMDQKGVMLRPNSLPLTGRDTVAKLFASRPDTGFSLTWSPLYADVAASGDLGYTYGTYLVKSRSESEEGTYCTVWKKDANGKWKYVIDTGNPGLKPPTQQK